MVSTAEQLEAFAAVPDDELREVIAAELARRSLAEYLRQWWAWKWPRKKLKWGWHIDAIAEHLEAVTAGQIKRLIINVPPRTLKSTIVSVAWPSWEWLHDPSLQYIAVSAIQSVVLRDAKAHLDTCRSDWYRQRFRPTWSLDPDQKAKGNFVTTEGGKRVSMTTGARVTGGDADRIVIDDPIDAADAFDDKAQLVEHCRYYDNSLQNRLNDDQESAIVLIMQRLHQRDLTGHILAKDALEFDTFEHLFLPAEYDGKSRSTSLGPYDPRTIKGEILFPARLPAAVLASKLKALRPRAYAGQYLQIPAPEGGALFRKKWIQHWIPGTLPELGFIFSSWDCAFKKSGDSDFVCGQVWGVIGGDFYLLDQVRKKMSFEDTLLEIRIMQAKWKCAAIVIETKANGKKVIKTLQHEIVGVQEFDPQGSTKPERARAVIPFWTARNVYLPSHENAPWVAEAFEPELLAFPNARRDDQVDAMTQALLWYRENGPTTPWVEVLV